jgi:hypothetical protein
MADTQAIDGRHIKMELLLDGVPQGAAAQATDMSAKARYDKIETKLLGDPSPLIDHDHIGWEGTTTFAVRNKSLDTMINAYNKSKRLGLPVVINMIQQITYRDRSSVMHVYPDCQVEFDSMGKRGSAAEIKVPWTTGKDRITI